MSAARSMGLGALTDAISPERVIGIPTGAVTGLTMDSRTATPGSVFFAVPGMREDGWQYAPEAVER